MALKKSEARLALEALAVGIGWVVIVAGIVIIPLAIGVSLDVVLTVGLLALPAIIVGYLVYHAIWGRD